MKNASALTLCTACLAACTTPMTPTSGPTASANMRPASGSQAQGSVKFTQAGERVRVEASITGLSPGAHGFHLHEKGDCSAPDAASAGGHFNPMAKKHGSAEGSERHAGDFGNLQADATGKASVSIVVDGISVGRGTDGIIGRGVVVHAGPDDLKTDPSGNSGGRIACGVVEE